MDAAGNEAAQSLELTVENKLPEAKLNAPVGGAKVANATVTVDVAVPSDVGLVAARAAGDRGTRGVFG